MVCHGSNDTADNVSDEEETWTDNEMGGKVTNLTRLDGGQSVQQRHKHE